MRVLVLTPYYAPDLGPSATLYEMLCEELARLGHSVSVVSAVPHYPTGQVPPYFRGRLVQRDFCRGVDVTRVRIPSLQRSKLRFRVLGLLCYQILGSVAIGRRRIDVVIASNPAFEVALPLAILALLRRIPFIYSIHELYPDIGVKLGIFRNPVLIRLLQHMEQWCCRKASYVRVISEVYKRTLERAGIPHSKLAVICDWADTDFISPSPRHNEFSARWDLDGCFVVLYAGNIGPTQGLDVVVRAAQRLEQHNHIRFVMVGDGASREELQHSVERSRATNITFIPFQPRALLPAVLSTADVFLLSLKKGLGTDSVPSKLFAALASGRPVIATVDPDSGISQTIHEACCGVVVEPENADALASVILDLSRNASLRARWGDNGRAYAVDCRSKKCAAAGFQKLLAAMVPLPDRAIKNTLS